MSSKKSFVTCVSLADTTAPIAPWHSDASARSVSKPRCIIANSVISRSIRSKQRVNEGRCARAAEHDEDAEQQQQHDDRRQPPFLVVTDEVPELAQEAARFTVGLVRKAAGTGLPV